MSHLNIKSLKDIKNPSVQDWDGNALSIACDFDTNNDDIDVINYCCEYPRREGDIWKFFVWFMAKDGTETTMPWNITKEEEDTIKEMVKDAGYLDNE